MSHDRLWAWVHDEEDDPAEVEAIRSHVAKCDVCRDQVDEMRDLLGDLDAVGLGGPSRESVGAKPEIPGYEIVRKIGQGGMGVVFEATQASPRRRVALKLIIAGSYADDLQQKLFQREVQTLARLNHPGIASIYDAGQTADGRQYFSMEFVEGTALNDFVKSHFTGQDRVRRILQIFQLVCDAISYAHQRGVIHRDLKPSNILVVDPQQTASSIAHTDSSRLRLPGKPKVLDFGLARLHEAEEGMPSINTATGQIMGTLVYMSPEQAQGRPDLVDVRSDVYALGVILYELLTDDLPYPIAKAPLLEAVRMICEQSPARPSSEQMPTDVSAIVLKALEKDPNRRYQSVAALFDDIDRYLNDLPILARPPSTVYQLRKMISRHRVPFSLAAMLLFAIIGASGFAYYQAIMIERSARQTRQIAGVFERSFQQPNPWLMGEKDVTVLETMDQAAKEIETRPVDDPIVTAGVRQTLANTYKAFGEFDKADRHYRYALKVRRENLGDDSAEVADTLSGLAENIFQRGGSLDEAQSHFEDALRIYHRDAHGPDDRVAGMLNNLGLVAKQQGRLDEAQSYYVEALGIRREILAERIADTNAKENDVKSARNDVAQTLNNLGALNRARRDFERAELYYRESRTLREKTLYEVHPDNAKSANNYGKLLYDLGRYDEARGEFARAVEILAKGLADDHPYRARAMHSLALTYYRLNDLDQSRTWCDRSLTMREKLIEQGRMQPRNGDLADSLSLKGVLLVEAGDLEQAESVLREAAAIGAEARGADDWRTAWAEAALGWCLLRNGEKDKGRSLLDRAAIVLFESLGESAAESRDVLAWKQ